MKKAFSIAELILSLFVLALVALAAVNVAFKKAKTLSEKANPIKPRIICNTGYCDFIPTSPFVEEKNKNSEEQEKEYKKFRKQGYIKYGYGNEYYAEMQSNEFIKITIVGGGAGGSEKTGGAGGEKRVIMYPSLVRPLSCETGYVPHGSRCCKSSDGIACDKNSPEKCIGGYIEKDGTCKVNFKYRIYVGKGGSVNQNGGDTKIVICENGKPCNEYSPVLESAAGGKAGVGFVERSEGINPADGREPHEEQWSSETEKTTGNESNDDGGNDMNGYGGAANNPGKNGEVIIEWK